LYNGVEINFKMAGKLSHKTVFQDTTSTFATFSTTNQFFWNS